MIRGEIMNDEIKEILDMLKHHISIISVEDEDLLLNYISNLEEKNNKLSFENIMLKMENNVYKQGYEELKELIEKAITEVNND